MSDPTITTLPPVICDAAVDLYIREDLGGDPLLLVPMLVDNISCRISYRQRYVPCTKKDFVKMRFDNVTITFSGIQTTEPILNLLDRLVIDQICVRGYFNLYGCRLTSASISAKDESIGITNLGKSLTYICDYAYTYVGTPSHIVRNTDILPVKTSLTTTAYNDRFTPIQLDASIQWLRDGESLQYVNAFPGLSQLSITGILNTKNGTSMPNEVYDMRDLSNQNIAVVESVTDKYDITQTQSWLARDTLLTGWSRFEMQTSEFTSARCMSLQYQWLPKGIGTSTSDNIDLYWYFQKDV